MFASYCTGREDAKGRCGSPSGSCSGSIAEPIATFRGRGFTHARPCVHADAQRKNGRLAMTAAHIAGRAIRASASAWDRLKVNRNWLGALVHAAGGGVPDPVPRLSARPRRLALVHRRPHRPRRRIRRPRELRVALGRFDVFWLSVFNTLLYTTVASIVKFAVGLYLALLLNENLPFKAMHARGRADSLHRADRAFGDRVLVDLRQPVLDHLLVAAETRADRDQHRFPRRRLERALVGDLRQHLARRAVRRHHAAGRPADGLAVALRGRDHRRRHAAGRSSATSPIRCSRRSSRW